MMPSGTDSEQASMLNRTFGCVRVVWNQTLAWRRQRYQADKAGMTYAQASASAWDAEAG